MDSHKTKTDYDCICPVCFKQVDPKCMEQGMLSADGIRRRSYSTWCPECSAGGQGYIVIQYYHGGRWHIEKYIQIQPLYIYHGKWQHVQEAMPQQQPEAQAPGFPPVVQTGPGGDFINTTTDADLSKALESYTNLITQLSTCGHLISDILLMKKKSI
jgi:hypothetical protein